MRRLGWWFGVVLLAALPAFPQAFPEVDAVVETFFAKDLDIVAKHLPTSLAEALANLPAAERAEIAHEYLPAERLKSEGKKVVRSEADGVLMAFESGPEDAVEAREVVLEKRISNGYEAMLRLNLRQKTGEEEGPGLDLLVWLRFEDGEWRIYQMESPSGGDQINLDDPKLLDQFRHSTVAAQEQAAVGAIRTYVSACFAYSQIYPDYGFPSSLDALAIGDSSEPDAGHAGLLDNLLSSPPYEKSGYRFDYRRQSSSSTSMGFVIIGRPIEFGKSGTRNFYADESGVVRFTEEDREPTNTDPPLR
jgi:hypothetical protein